MNCIFPSIRHCKSHCFLFSGWNCAIPDVCLVRSKWRTSCTLSRDELLEKFFTFYSDIPVERFVFRTSDGSMQRRKHFFRKYTQLKLDKELHTRVHDDFGGFCLQDPFDPFKNLTKNMKRFNTRKCIEFVEWCKETEELLKWR